MFKTREAWLQQPHGLMCPRARLVKNACFLRTFPLFNPKAKAVLKHTGCDWEAANKALFNCETPRPRWQKFLFHAVWRKTKTISLCLNRVPTWQPLELPSSHAGHPLSLCALILMTSCVFGALTLCSRGDSLTHSGTIKGLFHENSVLNISLLQQIPL